MRFTLGIACVNGTNLDISTEDIEHVNDFLQNQDHEGSFLTLRVETEDAEDVYAVLRALTALETA